MPTRSTPTMQLVSSALIVPERKNFFPQVLGAGSVVRLVAPDLQRASPVTEQIDEPFVEWRDVDGRDWLGWLARTTQLKPVASKLPLCNRRDGDMLVSPLDRIRDQVMMAKRKSTDGMHWNLVSWCSTFGESHLEELRAVVRELGGKVPSAADSTTVITRALRAMLNNPEVTMSEATKQETTKSAATKSASKKSASKKSAKKVEQPKRSATRTASAAAVTALEKAGAPGKLVALAKRLGTADAGLGKKEIVELRDGINEQAEKAREAKKDGVASQLSSVNRLVRRIARSL